MGFSLVSVFEVFYHIIGAGRKWWNRGTVVVTTTCDQVTTSCDQVTCDHAANRSNGKVLNRDNLGRNLSIKSSISLDSFKVQQQIKKKAVRGFYNKRTCANDDESEEEEDNIDKMWRSERLL